MSIASRIHGCLLGGALGDSLGYVIEFDGIETIRQRFGPDGLQDFSQLDSRTHFSDDTQMTLYTVDGLVEALEWANEGVAANENACLWLAYLRWLATQDVALPASAPRPQPRWIDAQEVLQHRRAPGNACLSGLATGEMGTQARPVNPGSKGCGTVMRSAPFGLVPHISAEAAFKLAYDASYLTHGHSAAAHSAGIFSVLIHGVCSGEQIRPALESALLHLNGRNPAPEVLSRINAALAASERASTGTLLSPEELVDTLGEGWVAEEALAVALYAVLATEASTTTPEEHFRAAIALAINHRGDSDSTGSIAGNILGAQYGMDAIPAQWLEVLESPETITHMADSLVAVTSGEV
ncbi:ADP-ribosylglycohydrolase family protein [Pseudarthrobacter sp. J1738]|uniref:ADP-ribosylglycohydrolase family protein n=1 Tax=unclassified Pseudarthrobacter TaxID=2647000 RepID=UPI003D26EC00